MPKEEYVASCFVAKTPSNTIDLVEAHSPFVQCVSWAPTPVTENGDESDRVINVVATGGTDKVGWNLWLNRQDLYPLPACQDMATVTQRAGTRSPRVRPRYNFVL